jgi:dephospho-CoA kinase
MSGDAYCFIGFPGAGKTTAMKQAEKVLGTPLSISTGDIVRKKAAAYHGVSLDELTGEEIGEFSTYKRSHDSPLYVARAVQEKLEDDFRWPNIPVVMEGVRDSEASAFYRSFIENFHIIFVHAPFETRLQRLRGRGREEDEAVMQSCDLMDREERELDWGMRSLPDEADAVVMNTGTEEELRKKINDTIYELQ